jgi:TonB-dependent receptor
VSQANLTKEIEETISAAYVRADLKFIDNRLWLVGGARFEYTSDEGRGVRNDLRNTYVQDDRGNLVLGPNQQPIRKTTNVLENARLQYQVKGAYSQTNYSGYYPSMNATFELRPDLVVRAAFARTIGRPDLPFVIPGLTVTVPSSSTVIPTITANNTGLLPWTANNYDLALEAYDFKGATLSVSLFQKDIKKFFVSYRESATSQRLAELGLSDDYLDYDIITRTNGGAAKLQGLEVDYRQSLLFLPSWARGVQIFGNATFMDLGGENADDFTNYTSKSGNWGASFTRPRYSARVSVNYTGLRRTSRAAPSATVAPDSYLYFAPQTRIDVSMSYMLTKRFTIYADVRNLMGVPLRRGTWGPSTPAYAKMDFTQYAGAAFTAGVKGSF